MNRGQFLAILAGVGGSFLMSGCITVAVREEAKPVRLAFNEGLVSNCRFRSDVIGSEGHWFNSWAIDNSTLIQAALNDLRNQAFDTGADTVFIPAFPYIFSTSVTMLGQAYACKGAVPLGQSK